MLLQIPAGWFAAKWGAKTLVSCQCLVISGVLLLLPTAARRGAWPAAACLFAFGLAQAPFVSTPPDRSSISGGDF